MITYRDDLIKKVTINILGRRLMQLQRLMDRRDPIYPAIKEDYCFIKNQIRRLIMEV